MDDPNKFDWGAPAPAELRLRTQLISKRQIINSWNARARAIGFDSVGHMLEHLEQSGAKVQYIPRFAATPTAPQPIAGDIND